MKKNNTTNVIVKCLTSVALLFSLSASYAQIPSTNLKAYWPLEGNAQDLSGNNNNGAITGATLTTDRFNRTNGAFEFQVNSGVLATINVPNSNSLQVTKPFTVSLWCMNYGKSMTLIRKGGDWGIDFGNSTGGSFGDYLSVFAKNASGSVEVKTTTSPLPLNSWMHVVAVFDNTTTNNVKLYINNSLVLTTTFASTSSISTQPVTIGSYNSEFYTGKIDDVRIYNKALNTNEIASLSNEQKYITNVTVTDDTPTNGLQFCNNSSYTTTGVTFNHILPSGTNIQYYLVSSTGTTYSCGASTITTSPSNFGWNINSSVPAGTGYTFKIKSTNPVFEYVHPALIDVYNLPSPIISNTSPINFCDGNQVTLNSSCSFSSTVATWKLNNVDISGYNFYMYPQNLTTATAGTYAVYYSDANRCVVKSNSVIVNSATTINKPIVTRTGNYSNCQGYVRTFTTTAVAGESLQWYINGNAIQGATSNTLTVNAYGFNTGSNNITVKATNTLGCSNTSDPYNIVINDNPTAPQITSSITPICSFPATLSTNYSSVRWYVNTYGSTATQGNSFTINAAGNYLAYYIDPSTGCSSPLASYSVAPLPTVTISGNQYVCSGSNTSLSATTGFASYNWSTGATTQNINATAGSYTVTAANTAGCSASASINVTNKIATSNLPCNFTTNKLNIAVNASLPSGFTSSEIVSYKFKLYSLSGALLGEKTQASSSIVLQDLPGIEFNKTFNWTVQVQYTCGGSTQWGPESNPCPLNILIPNVQVECGLYFESLYNSSMVLNIPTTNSSLVSNYVFTFYGPTQPITYTSSSPVINFSAVPNLQINNDYEWTVQARYKTNGTFTLSPMNTPCVISFWDPSFFGGKLANNNNTGETPEVTVKVKGCCLDSERVEKHKFKIYPNPSNNGNATIDLENENTSATIFVRDVTGREIIHLDNVNEKMIHINTTHIEKGVYVVLVEMEGELLTERLIVE